MFIPPKDQKKWIKRYDVIGYIWSYEEDLEKDDKVILDKVLQDHPTVKIAYDLVQKFRKLINHRNLAELDAWIENAKQATISKIASFARGLEATKQEVQNALIFHYSNGSVEGNINRLKMIKRLMYGRANLDLLAQRVLYQL